jgi:hypothetical protein
MLGVSAASIYAGPGGSSKMGWIIGSVVIVSIVLFVLRALKGLTYPIEDIERATKMLLRQGYADGRLILEVCRYKYLLGFSSQYVLEFRKVIHAPKNYGMRLCFSERRAQWSHVTIQMVQEFCDKRDIRYFTTKDEQHKSHTLFAIDCGPDYTRAYTICKDMLLEVFQLREDAQFFFTFTHCTVRDTLIER